jgi:hypothetical protein
MPPLRIESFDDCATSDRERFVNRRRYVMKLNIKAFSLACGLIWGVGLFLLTWWIIAFDGPTREVTLIGRVYRGYTISPGGSIFGLVWGFVDGLIGGAVFAWVYNLIARHSVIAPLTPVESSQQAPVSR